MAGGSTANTDRRGRCNCELAGLIFSFFFGLIDLVVDGLGIYNFYTEGHVLLFVLNLVFSVASALFIHLVITIKMWKVISNRMTEDQSNFKKTSDNMEVVKGFFVAVPQLFIQVTALRMGILKDSAVFLSYVKMVFSCVNASSALLTVFSEKMNKYLQKLSAVLVALVLGSRVFVCASLFSLEGPLLCTGFLPIAFSVLLAWVTDNVFKREKVSILRAYIKATLLPPEDKAGVVASLVYCAFGLVFWLLTISEPLSVLVFVGVTVIHILGGIWWSILNRHGH